MKKIIARADICKILEDWEAGKMTAQEVHAWAESCYAVSGVEYDDNEGDEDNSVANEVMARLDMLNLDLMFPEDIPIYLEFLQAPKNGFAAAFRKWDAALQNIDRKARAQNLKNDPLYEPYCLSKVWALDQASQKDLMCLKGMRKAIITARSRSGDIGRLADELHLCRDQLQLKDADWEHELTQHIATLDSSSTFIPKDDKQSRAMQAAVSSAMDSLLLLIARKFHSLSSL